MKEYRLTGYICENCAFEEYQIVVSDDELVDEQKQQSLLKGKFYKDPTFADKMSFVQSKYSSDLVECNNCSLVFRSTRPKEKDIVKIYKEERLTPEYDQAWIDSWRKIFNRLLGEIERRKPGKGRLVDIGSQLGLFPEIASANGWEAYGVDPSDYTFKRAQERGVELFHGILTEAEFPDEFFDVATCWTVFENLPHFKTDLAEVRRILKPNGLFALKVANFDFYRRLRKVPFIGKNVVLSRLHLLGFPYQYGFTPDTLRSILGAEGFTDVSVQNYKLSISLNRNLKPEIVFLEKTSKGIINFISESVSYLTGGQKIIGPWMEVYAHKSFEK